MKNKEKYKAIGLMSGTSLDGLDLAFCEFEIEDGLWSYQIHGTETRSYPEELYNFLKTAVEFSGLELTKLDVELGQWMGKVVKSFIDSNQFEVDFIASHGHTVFHQPESGITMQIGNGNSIAAISQLPVVYDFRSLDVALGGQGAPLVPIGDALLFHGYDYCLNLGGIANISFHKDGRRLAYDICPCNMALNYIANKKGHNYDKGGAIAREGKLLPGLLEVLDNLAFYKQPYPKSLGYEWVSENVLNVINGCPDSLADIMRTLAEHIANQIAQALMKEESGQKLLVTGGGAFNHFLIELLRERLKEKVEVCIPDDTTINFKEALIFAFLGVLRIRGEVNCLSSVTGSSQDSCGGVLTH
ncbi:anhydro-N-acetylmuramic acid kinase [Fulvivirga ulvae]|uniref:anhydro-N-acetylmuramic acid kinase n=1 Tax=Fulvivirga ulvae TaxID=2904245 RepID=UPI001F3F38E4|nr:anhydro-N-acetylmuramic acid kinase [Fulvivirga ulvae]UII33461.1 anhydro-N-acetylmuramic acid kinase [Fulvivirga ulvae]